MAALDLTFVDEPPPPLRAAPGATGCATKAVRANGRPNLVTETGDRYVAPDTRRPHGARAKYVIEKCRCLDCTLAAREYNKKHRRAIARPDEAWVAYVPARRARRHLEELQAQGIGYKTVADIAGLAPSTVGKILWPARYRKMGVSKGIRPETEAKILAVTPTQVSGAQRVPSGPSWALVDDLRAQGFYPGWIAEQLGIRPSNFRRRPLIHAATARKIERLHTDWSGRTPPRKRSRWHQ